MTDVFTKEKRSQVMSRIRGRGNKDTEVAFARILRTEGITGWRRHYAAFGKPDFAFPSLRIAVFIDGCFWHQCPRCATLPASNRRFWSRKFSANQDRDRLVSATLRRQGWRVVRLWEHELRNGRRVGRRMRRLLDARIDSPVIRRHRGCGTQT